MKDNTTISPEWKYFAGLDVSDSYTHYCVLDQAGDTVLEGKIRTERVALHRLLHQFSEMRLALEVGPHSRWMAAMLSEMGIEVLVANARKVRLIHGGTTKNDRVDAEKLARLCRFDPTLLYPIQHRSHEHQTDKEYLAARSALVRSRTMHTNHIRGVLKSNGLKLPKTGPEKLPERAKEFLTSEMPYMLDALGPLLEVVTMINEKIRWYDREIERLGREKYSTEMWALRQVNGVGPVTSMTYILTISDPFRFKKSRQLGAYLGLRPAQDSSGNHNPELRITKAGNSNLRYLLVQCAHYILGPFGKDCDLRRWGLRKAEGGKRARQRAIVAVARRLAVLLHRLWVTGEVYEPLRHSRTEEVPCVQAA